jgi:hypothetical protein
LTFRPRELWITPEFAAWLEIRGLGVLEIRVTGDGLSTMTLAPIEDDDPPSEDGDPPGDE